MLHAKLGDRLVWQVASKSPFVSFRVSILKCSWGLMLSCPDPDHNRKSIVISYYMDGEKINKIERRKEFVGF